MSCLSGNCPICGSGRPCTWGNLIDTLPGFRQELLSRASRGNAPPCSGSQEEPGCPQAFRIPCAPRHGAAPSGHPHADPLPHRIPAPLCQVACARPAWRAWRRRRSCGPDGGRRRHAVCRSSLAPTSLLPAVPPPTRAAGGAAARGDAVMRLASSLDARWAGCARWPGAGAPRAASTPPLLLSWHVTSIRHPALRCPLERVVVKVTSTNSGPCLPHLRPGPLWPYSVRQALRRARPCEAGGDSHCTRHTYFETIS